MTRIAITGAGSVEFTAELVADILRFPELREVEFGLHDIDEERLAVAEGVVARISEQLGAGARASASLDRREAIAGADFVINTIQVGGIEATRRDLEIPARRGLLQTIGDTTGVGGVFRALRTFPVLTEIAEDIRAEAPDAWLLNYTNPMSMNIGWLGTTAPDVKAVGLCHSVFWTANDLCELIGVPLEGTTYRAAGVNHQAWLLTWEREGQSLYPRLREAIAADPGLERRVRVEIFRRLGYYPTETSEHSSEYLSWFLRDPAQVERFRIEPLQYLRISEDNVATFEATRAALAAGEDLPIDDSSTEYAPQVIHSMVTGQEREIHGNVINRGYITNLPDGAAVEVPCRVSAAGLEPVPMGDLPPQCAAQNGPYLAVGALTIEAARTGTPALVRQALLMDPNASSTLTPRELWELADELVAAHGDLLPEPLRAPLPPDAR